MSFFEDREFYCRCNRPECDKRIGPSPELLRVLNAIRGDLGRPLFVTSGNRCDYWNRQHGGEDDGEHERAGGCEGADLKTASAHERYELIVTGHKHGITRFGIGPDFVHLGVGRDGDVPEVMWDYYAKKKTPEVA